MCVTSGRLQEIPVFLLCQGPYWRRKHVYKKITTTWKVILPKFNRPGNYGSCSPQLVLLFCCCCCLIRSGQLTEILCPFWKLFCVSFSQRLLCYSLGKLLQLSVILFSHYFTTWQRCYCNSIAKISNNFLLSFNNTDYRSS